MGNMNRLEIHSNEFGSVDIVLAGAWGMSVYVLHAGDTIEAECAYTLPHAHVEIHSVTVSEKRNDR
jgi:hypothetical protein